MSELAIISIIIIIIIMIIILIVGRNKKKDNILFKLGSIIGIIGLILIYISCPGIQI